MIGDTDLIALISAIYEAGIDFSRWPNALARLATAFDAPSAGLARNGLTADACWVITSAQEPRLASDYADYYHGVNPIWRLTPATPAGTVQTDNMVMPREQLARTEFFQDFLRPYGIGGMLNAVALLEDGRQTVVTVHARRELRDDQVALYRLLTPHLRRAVQLNVRLSAASINYAATMEVVDRLDEGVLFVDEVAKVVFANRAAEALFATNGGLRRKADQLQAAIVSETAALHAVIARCGDMDGRQGHALNLTQGLNRPPLTVRVTPVSDNLPGWIIGGRPVAIITVSDPGQKIRPQPARLQALFGLTAAQAALAVEILAGDGIQAAADRLGITRATARSHLARIFEKTGARRQAELVRMLMAETASLTAG
jgi:DNA-binding CsgD family transcriptional regulator/PAS domain-containing protein